MPSVSTSVRLLFRCARRDPVGRQPAGFRLSAPVGGVMKCGGRGPRWVPRPVVRPAIGILATLLVLEYRLLPQIPGPRQTLRLLSGINGWWLALGLIAEVASLLAYARLSQQA